jgi:hypothetical protein
MANTEGRRLAGSVYIDGTVYRAGEVPSPEHAAKITNPKAWETDDDVQARQGSDVDGAGAEPSGPATGSQVGGEDEEPAAGADSDDATASRTSRPKKAR